PWASLPTLSSSVVLRSGHVASNDRCRDVRFLDFFGLGANQVWASPALTPFRTVVEKVDRLGRFAWVGAERCPVVVATLGIVTQLGQGVVGILCRLEHVVVKREGAFEPIAKRLKEHARVRVPL